MNVKLLFSIILLIFIKQAAAQDVLPVIQTGHRNDITYHDNDVQNHILLTGDEREIILWNTLTGKQLRRIPLAFTIRGAVLCQATQEIAVIVYDHGRNASLRFFKTRDGSESGKLDFFDTHGSDIYWKPLDKLVRNSDGSILGVKHFTTLETIEVKTKLVKEKLRLPFDSRFCFVKDSKEILVAFNEEDSLKVSLLDSSGNSIKKLAIHPKRKPATLTGDKSGQSFYLLDDKATISILNKDLKLTDSIKADSINSAWTTSPPSLALNEPGTKLLAPLGSNHFLYDLQEKKWIHSLKKESHKGSNLIFINAEGTRMGEASDQTARIIDIASGEDLFFLYANTKPLENILFTPSGRFVSTSSISSYSKTSYVLDLSNGVPVNETGFDFAITRWITDSVALCIMNEEYDDKTGEFIRKVQLRNVYTGAVLRSLYQPGAKSFSEAIISNDGNHIAFLDGLYGYVYYSSGPDFRKVHTHKIPDQQTSYTIRFSPDSRQLIVGTTVIRVMDLKTSKWTAVKDTATVYGYSDLAVTSDSRQLWYVDLDKNIVQTIKSYDLASRQTGIRRTSDTLISSIAVHPTKDLYAIGFFNGAIQLRSILSDSLLYSAKLHNGVVRELQFQSTNSWLATLGEDWVLSLFDYDKKEVVVNCALMVKGKNNGFALFTPRNYYLVPPSVVSALHFAKGYEAYSFAQFDLQLNRPDKVLERIGLTDTALLLVHHKAFRKRLIKSGVSKEAVPDFTSLHPLLIHNKNIYGTTSSEGYLQLGLSTLQPKETIKALLVYINGQVTNTLPGPSSKWDLPVELNLGQNNIEIAYLTNDGTESLRERLEVNYSPSATVASKTIYIGVAVSKYIDSTRNLHYAVKDVEDIAAKFKSFNNQVEAYLFTNDEVTLPVLDSISKILRTTQVNDKVVLSFSGHGMLDTALNFYFGTYDIDFEEPAKRGISYDAISALFDGVPARQKLVLIDACHSGETDSDLVFSTANPASDSVVSFKPRSTIKKTSKGSKLKSTVRLMQEYFADVSKANGVNIVSAAAGEEFALEGVEWNNGVFSYCFMQGFFEKKADRDGNDRISQTEIRNYMQQEVQRLTKGRQRPTSRSMNADYDWEL